MNNKKILIAGGGGFGCELWTYLSQEIVVGRLAGYTLAGVLDDGLDCELLRSMPEAKHISTIKDYAPLVNEVVLIGVGSVVGRRKIAALIRSKGGRLFTYVHMSALVAPSVHIGEGCVVCPNTIINAGAVLEENVAINVFCSIGHGAKVGSNSVLSPYCSLSGDSSLGAGGFMGTRATLFPKIALGEACVVDAHTAVRQSTGAAKIISTRGQYLVLDNRFAPKT